MTNPDGSQPTGSQGGQLNTGLGIASSLLGFAGGMYDSYQNRKTARQNTDKTIAANKAESELAYQRSVEQWNAQNLYNSPEAQMARFKSAGLNPHLIYGQGNPGNASSPVNYQPARVQYDYAAGNYGATIQSILPTLMSVGTWMQQMRSSEAQIQSTNTNTQRAQQVIDYLVEMNPKLLEQMSNRLSLFPYQRDATRFATDTANLKLFQNEQEFRYQYGDDLYKNYGSSYEGPRAPISGMKKVQLLQQMSRNQILEYDKKLKEAQSSWTDFDITNPQAIMQMVAQGIFGLAGQTLRLNQKRRPVTHELEHRMKGGRVNIRRRIY